MASSNPIKDDDNDPLCIGAKQVYESIMREVGGSFECVGEQPTERSPGVMEFEIGVNGPRLKSSLMAGSAVVGPGAIGRQPLAHGNGKS